MLLRTLLCTWLATVVGISAETKPESAPKPADNKPAITPELKAALEKLQMPGVKINLEEWCVDVEAKVCLDVGLLELVVCTKDTKEHESILMIEAKPSHIHTALLLIGAKNGSPAMQHAIDAEMTRFRHVLPSGDPINVFLVWNEDGKTIEKPISEFIVEAEDYDAPILGEEKSEARKNFPTHTFLFAGSILIPGKDDGPKRYLCDEVGNVISISTFGDELLCLPDITEHSNGSLSWEANSEALPAVDTKVTLRLRPAKAKP